jgi:hypothetical protein
MTTDQDIVLKLAKIEEEFEDVETLLSASDKAYMKQTAFIALLRAPSGANPEEALLGIKTFYREHADWILRQHEASGAADRLFKTLLALKPTTRPPTTPQEEVAAHQRDFNRANPQYRGVEIDALKELLVPGEHIVAVCDDHIETDKPRSINRYDLRNLRPANTTTDKAIFNWEKNFPSKQQIEEGARATRDAIERGDY